MTFEGSDRRVEIVSYGTGHTESDLFAHIPDADVLVMGDLLWVGHHPRANDGDAMAWADVLDRMRGLGPTALVPGHGAVAGVDASEYLAGYLRAVAELVDDAITGGLDAEAINKIPVPAGSEDWGSVGRFYGSISSLAETRPGLSPGRPNLTAHTAQHGETHDTPPRPIAIAAALLATACGGTDTAVDTPVGVGESRRHSLQASTRPPRVWWSSMCARPASSARATSVVPINIDFYEAVVPQRPRRTRQGRAVRPLLPHRAIAAGRRST